jgi:hypothetical protein
LRRASARARSCPSTWAAPPRRSPDRKVSARDSRVFRGRSRPRLPERFGPAGRIR